MKANSFAILAGVAALCLLAAVFTYSASIPWSHVSSTGAALFPNLKSEAGRVSRIEVRKGDDALTIERNGSEWLIKERSGFRANNEKVRSLLVKLTEAELLEPKTRNKDHFALLELEEPSGPGATSRLVRLLDDKGAVIDEVIVGKQRWDAFGSGKGGTYVRRPNEQQTWLVSTPIDASVEFRDWVKSQLFETKSSTIKHMTVEVPGEEPLQIDYDLAAKEHKLSNMPNGMKLRDVNAIDYIADGASSLDFDDARKAGAVPPAPADKVNTVTLDLEDGVKVVLKINRDNGAAWLTLTATGEGTAKAAADALNAHVQGWEFQIPASKADAILKKRGDLLEKAAS